MRKCVFINLDDATARRDALEASWPNPPGWTLERFSAVRVDGRPEDLPGAVGCFLSHRHVIGANLDDDEPLMVVEDDARFGPSTFANIDALLAQPHNWDMLLVDVNPLDTTLLTMLARDRETLAATPGLRLYDVRGRPWAGTTAYVVRGGAKRRLFDLISGDINRPIDLFIRKLCDDGKLSIAVCLPFLTTASSATEATQIGSTLWHRPLALFRRMMWIDRDVPACEAEAARLTADNVPAARVLGAAIGAIAIPSPSAPRRPGT